MKNSTKVKAGLLLTSLACAAGATAALVMLQKKREEEVYHEAELKAMDELEEMMRAESDCASCACAEECAETWVYVDAFDDAPKAAEPAALESQTESDVEPEADDVPYDEYYIGKLSGILRICEGSGGDRRA